MIPTFDIVKMSKNVEKFEQAMRDRNREITRLLNTSFSFTVEKPGTIHAQFFLDTRILKTYYIDTVQIFKTMSATSIFNGFIQDIKNDLRQIYIQENPQPQMNINDFLENDDEWLVTSDYEESVDKWSQAFDVAWNNNQPVPVPLGKMLQVMHTEISKGMQVNIAEITQTYLNEITGVTIGDLSADTIFLIVKSLFSPSDSLPRVPISLNVKDTENITAGNLKEKVIPGGPSITVDNYKGKVYIGNGNLFYILL